MNTWTSPSAEARADYERDGFLCPIDFLSDAEILECRSAFDALEAVEGREKSVIELKGRHFDQRFIWDLVTQPRLLDWIESLMGPNLLLLSTHFFCKYPGGDDGHFVAWHQDVAYWGLEPANAITAWIAIDDSNPENGCMEVIPGTHSNGVVDHAKSAQPNNLLASNQAIPEASLAVDTALPFELQAGQMSIHHGALVHASQPNRSRKRRCGLTARYITPEVRQVKPSNNAQPWWKPIVVRGSDDVRNFPAQAPPF